MAEVVQTASEPSDGIAGWIAAFIILFAVVVGGYFSYRAGFFGALVAEPGTPLGAQLPPDLPNTGSIERSQ